MSKKPDELLFDYEISENGSFIIKNYNLSNSFASFLPGIAGTYGIPMWVFYVNRGQCISSLGVDGKDKAIVEFFSANRAYQLTPTTGFRTFYKLNGEDFFEAFTKPRAASYDSIKQEMEIFSYGVKIREENLRHGISTKVSYFTVPNEPLAVFARLVTIQNISKKSVDMEILDGIPQIATYGLSHELLKSLTNLTEAWATVEGIHQRSPFYKIKAAVKDTPDLELVQSGNFYFSKMMDSSDLSEIIVDPKLIFGEDEAFIYPENFADQENFKVPFEQRSMNLFPCAFSYKQLTLKPFEEMSFVSFCGNARNSEIFEGFKNKVCKVANYVEKKSEENRGIIECIQEKVFTVSSDKRFDFYNRQNYLDNVMRGGLPYQLDKNDKKSIFYIYSRKHGDMERDYNFFKIPPTYLSQGNGNYRDVNQNRRNDVNLNPDVGDYAIKTFCDLLQLDGYNPLQINGTKFFIENEDTIRAILTKHLKDHHDKIIGIIRTGYTPGELLITIENDKIALRTDREEFIRELLDASERFENSEFGEGYWTDHWHYNLDMIESYLSVYPEKEKELFFDDKTYTYFETYVKVADRTQKYFLTPKGVRQYHSIKEDKDKRKTLLKRERNPYAVRTAYGKGNLYHTCLFAKLVIVAMNKTATLDPFGVGIEFEANRPNWYDALNGLSGLLGSSSSETFELKRLAVMLKRTVIDLGLSGSGTISLPKEAHEFFRELLEALDDKKSHSFVQWDLRNAAKEKFRTAIYNGVEGTEVPVNMTDLIKFFDLVIAKTNEGIAKAMDPKSGLPFTYFINEVTDYDKIDVTDPNNTRVMPKAFKQMPLALFLEGVVHDLRTEADYAKAVAVHKAVMHSDLYDKKLRMFKVCASLEKESLDIGRTKIFPSGWLENESVWLHMEYKYLLELLKCGCYEEFFTTMKDILVPYLDPKVYGRSILENSSFIVSSAYFDKTKHGRGFYARLTGSTAEFVNIWVIMTSGMKPFFVDQNGQLALTFKPIIPGEFFTTKPEKISFHFDYKNGSSKKTDLKIPRDSFVFKFLGTIPVIYVNPHRLDTWTEHVSVDKIKLFGYEGELLKEFSGDTIAGEWANKIRDRDGIFNIEVHFKS